MASRKLKTWSEVKGLRPLSAEAQASDAAWVEEQIDALPTVAELDAETRFRARAALGSREQGLRLLDELERSE